MDDDDFSATADLLEEGDIPLRSFRIVEYLNEDGDVGTRWEVGGAPTIRESLAMLEVARFQVGAQIIAAEGD